MYLVPLAPPNSSPKFNLAAFQEAPPNPDLDKEKKGEKKHSAQCDGAGKTLKENLKRIALKCTRTAGANGGSLGKARYPASTERQNKQNKGKMEH